jgi:hypothetical protein
MVPLQAPASASLLPWVKWETESHITPKFGHIPPVLGPKNDFRNKAASRAAGSPEKVGRTEAGVPAADLGMLRV